MPNSNLPNQSHDCKEYAEVIASHERRINDFSEWKSQISNELSVIKSNQLSNAETMKETRQEIVGQLTKIADAQQFMQLENATLLATIRAEEKYKNQKQIDSKWLTGIFMSIPQHLITLALIFAALKYIPK